jgi:hypothetical protein
MLPKGAGLRKLGSDITPAMVELRLWRSMCRSCRTQTKSYDKTGGQQLQTAMHLHSSFENDFDQG